MKGTEITRALEELHIRKPCYRVLALLPLVAVAWADGKMQRAERRMIQRLADEKGWLTDHAKELFAGWLREPPSSEYVAKGLEVLRALAEQDRGLAGTSIRTDTLEHLVAYCRDVANAAGGVFGLYDPMSDDQIATLEHIAQALDLDGGRTWQQIAAAADAHAHDLPPAPKGHLLLGHLTALVQDPLGLVVRSVREHGDVVCLRVPGELLVVIANPEDVEHVLVTAKDNYLRGEEYETMGKVIGKSLLTTDGEEWRRSRRISQPVFGKKRLLHLADVVVEKTQAMLDHWASRVDAGDHRIDVDREMMQLTLSVIGWLMFSTELGDGASEIGEAVQVTLRHATEAMSNPFRVPDVVPTPDNLRLRRATAVFDELIFGLTRSRREQSESERPSDLLTIMMSATDEETGEALEDEQLRNEMLTFLIAGHETTALALTWTLYALSKHPVVRRRVIAEIDDILGTDVATLERAEKLTYTRAAIDESMRLYPPAPIMSRRARVEDEIGGYRIPKDANVLVCPFVTHRHPATWPNPEGFDPDRFAPEAAAGRHRHAYLPFAAGPHKCIGMGLAYMELHLILPMVLQHFELDLAPGFEPGFDPAVTLGTKNGLVMDLRPRG